MPNHFDFLIKLKGEEELLATANLTGLEDLSGFVSKQFSNLFSSYTKAFNKKHDRRGSLYMPNFKKNPITSSAYITLIIPREI